MVSSQQYWSVTELDDLFQKLNFDFRFGQEVNVKLGSPFCKYLLTIKDVYNGAKSCNSPPVVVEI